MNQNLLFALDESHFAGEPSNLVSPSTGLPSITGCWSSASSLSGSHEQWTIHDERSKMLISLQKIRRKVRFLELVDTYIEPHAVKRSLPKMCRFPATIYSTTVFLGQLISGWRGRNGSMLYSHLKCHCLFQQKSTHNSTPGQMTLWVWAARLDFEQLLAKQSGSPPTHSEADGSLRPVKWRNTMFLFYPDAVIWVWGISVTWHPTDISKVLPW